MATRVASLFADLKLNDELTGGLQKASTGLTSFSNQLDSAGRKLTDIGTGFIKLGGPITAVAGVAVGFAVNFENAMTNAHAILGVTGDEAKALSDQVLAMGSQAVAGPQATAEAFYSIVSGVQDATTHMAILDAAIATSEAGQANLQATTGALVGIMNAYGLEAEDAARVSDILTNTVNNGVLTMDELAAALPNITSMASSMNIPLETMAGSLALITQTGTSASVASTQLRAAMTALQNPNESLARAFEELGFASGQALVDEYGFVGAMRELGNTATSAEDGMAKMLGSTEALQAYMALHSDEALEFFPNFIEGVDGATDAARAIQLQSPAAQFALLKSEVQGAAIEIGRALLPAILDILRQARPFVRLFVDFVRENRKTIVIVAGIAAAFVGIGTALAIVGTAISGFAGLVGAVGIAMGLLLGPIGLLIAAAALLGAAYYTNFLGIGDAIDGLIQSFSKLWEAISPFVEGLIGGIWEGIQEGDWGKIETAFTENMGGILLNTGIAIAPLLLDLFSFYNELPEIMLSVADFVADVIGSIPAAFDLAMTIFGVYAFVKNAIASIFIIPLADIGTAVLAMYQLGEAAIGGLVQAFTDLIGGGLGFIYNNLINPLLMGLTDEANSASLTNVATILATQVIDAISGGLGAELGEGLLWIQEHVIAPLVAGLSDDFNIGSIVSAALEIGTALMEAIGAGVSGAISTVEGAIKGAINAIIPDHFGFTVAGFDLGGGVKWDGATVGIDIPDPFPNYQRGAAFTGFGMAGRLAGLVHAGEAVVPAGGMMVKPSPSGLVASGGGSGAKIYIDKVYVEKPRNYEELYHKILEVAARKSPQLRAP